MFGGPRMRAGDSECGWDFDKYVQRFVSEPFSLSPYESSTRKVEDLWKDRRLRLYKSAEETTEGKIVSWERTTPGGFRPSIEWTVKIALDDDDMLFAGDEVEIREYPKAHRFD